MSGSRDPFKQIEELFEQLNSGFAEMSEEFEGAAPTGAGIDVDVADADDEIVVTADVPGFDPSEIDVSVTDRRLRIAAEHSEAAETEDAQYYRRERSRRSVSRTVSLPTDVVESEAAASHENGVLTVTLPKASEADGVDIQID